ncbi:branched-chain amino acid ABC transporter permease [Oceaniglobus roseus]|uniref:branched-chain amino acid ABC transporter permease n=1 Tax=Oceaniglobus roseus TaxID=1737570 RepID=UPI000C7EA385|nr:branched-chain amino acid ABC transporter permease [Kandeliimicrobium roseum]
MTGKDAALHLGVLAVLLAAFFVLPEYHSGSLARIMVLAVYAMGYNLAFGYTGLLSLGHALFFAAGMYGLALSMQIGGWPALPAFLLALGAALAVAGAVGVLALRTRGVGFMIVTLMFAQAGYLTVLYFGAWTRGDEGFALPQEVRNLFGLDVTTPAGRYFAALALFAVVLLALGALVRAPFGRTLIAIRENEARAAMLGYDVQRLKWIAFVVSGVVSGAAGAAYALLFGYAGATFAGVQYSIFPLLYVLLGGAGTTLGPFVGAVFMFYLIDLSSGITTAYMLVAGLALVLLTLFLPQGILGTLRRRALPWLP